MPRKIIFYLLTCTAIVWLSSCGHSVKTNVTVPKEATFVVHINGASLASKITWQEIKQDEAFQRIYKNEKDTLAQKILDDPDNSGIDLKSDMTWFISKRGNNSSYMCFEASLKNAAAFENVIKKVAEGKTINKDGELSNCHLDHHTVLTWNASRFIYVQQSPDFDFASKFHIAPRQYREHERLSEDTLQAIGKQLFNLPSDDNLGTDGRFADLIAEPGDMHFWTNTGEMLSSMTGSFLNMLKLSALFDNNLGAATLSFDDGKITIKSKHYYNKDLIDIYKKYPSGPISADAINRIPSQNVDAVFAGKYDPKAVKEIMVLMGLDGMVNSGLGTINSNLDEVIKAHKGDLLIALTDLQWKNGGEDSVDIGNGQKMAIHRGGRPDAEFLFAASVNDKPTFDKILSGLNSTYPDEMKKLAEKTTYKIDNNWFVLGSKADQVSQFLAGGNNKFPFTDRLAGNAIGVYVDAQKVMKAFQSGASGENASKEMLDLSQATWQDVYLTSSGVSNGTVNGLLEINMVDKKTNSLKQLHQYIAKMANIAAKDMNRGSDVELKDMQMPQVDTTMAPKH